MFGYFDFADAFWAAWNRRFLALPHPRQIQVMNYLRGHDCKDCVVGYEWRELAEAAAREAEMTNSICI